MTLIEAIKSGKPFRRRNSPSLEWYMANCPSVCAVFHYSDIEATDWEIEETRVSITRGDIQRAWDRVMDMKDSPEQMYRSEVRRGLDRALIDFCRALGLEG